MLGACGCWGRGCGDTVNMKLMQIEVPLGLDLAWSQVGRKSKKKKKKSWRIDMEAEIKQDYRDDFSGVSRRTGSKC